MFLLMLAIDAIKNRVFFTHRTAKHCTCLAADLDCFQGAAKI